jgi:hypothetical protein
MTRSSISLTNGKTGNGSRYILQPMYLLKCINTQLDISRKCVQFLMEGNIAVSPTLCWSIRNRNIVFED